ncbi:hypothetical protein PENSUB_8559 [Penicillium subrubescens]|jgi:hypothetical protein|uniref:Uncharacterized protein n=1 Tax=Penicillium subrubescens TaxID=1316194 RepID=A0A1Q5TG27_9EURO|nr:hypothetical protein PENSUB_8559 [Penicillium subrubescens]
MDTVIKVGLTPKNDPEVFQDYHIWYTTEHIHRLKKVEVGSQGVATDCSSKSA